MAQNLPDEKTVYLALKGVFSGQSGLIRQEKKVRALIQKQQGQAEIKHLIKEHTIVRLSQTAKALLKDQIFESTLKARERFPEVFEVSPDQTAERAVSELAAAENEDAAFQNVAEEHQEKYPQPEENLVVGNIDQNMNPDTFGPKHTKRITTGVSLYPVYFPFPVQHRLLTRIQSILENTCYAFGQNHFPDALHKEGWDCTEAVELNRWQRVFLKHQEELDTTELEMPLPDLLKSIAQVRHTAVHRLRITANRMLQFVIDAEALVKLLQDEHALTVVSRMRSHIQSTIGEMECNKDLLELQMANTRTNFAKKRAELEAQEREALNCTAKEDKEYTAFAGASFEQALATPGPTAEPASHEASSETQMSWFSGTFWTTLGDWRKRYTMWP